MQTEIRPLVVETDALPTAETVETLDGLDQSALLHALRKLRNGDFRVRLPEGAPGIEGSIAETFNDIVELNQRTAHELRRISRAVGREGRISHRVSIGPWGSWARNEEAVNQLVFDLTGPMLEVSRVLDAVARGDLSQRMASTIDGKPLKGEYKRLADTINTMVDQLNAFSSEVTRVAREVGTEGKLGGQADVKGVAGVWKDLTDSVNFMAGNLTTQVRNIAEVTTAVANGDLSKKIQVNVQGEILELKDTINTMVDQLNAFAGEVTRVAREVGTEGKLGGQANVQGVGGTWKDLTDSVNSMAGNLTGQVRNIADVTKAVARGDLSRKITVDVQGEILELKDTINTMVDQLNAFAGEVTRVAHEVGTEGKLGGQATVPGVAGVWENLTDNVNSMAANLTTQVRNIADVTTAVARGNLSKKITVDARGEILELKDTINTMVDQLNAFASEVSRVAREVGTEGKLGGQADVQGVGGTWKDLTDNVNQLAANLTTQVRAIGQVATAVTRGDLSRSVQVDAQGEVELLKDDVNAMIRNLRETTQRNQEVDWLKTNIARFGRLLQGQRDVRTVGRLILTELAPLVGVQRGVIYISDLDPESPKLSLLATYPSHLTPAPAPTIRVGEGLLGQCAEDRRRTQLRDIPADYATIRSSLGGTSPRQIVLLPVLFEDQTRAVIELASVEELSDIHLAFLDQLAESIGIVLTTIAANMRAEDLVQEQAARVEAEAGLARLRQVVDVMPEAILIADAAGLVYLSNAAAAEIMGAVPNAVTSDGDPLGAPGGRRVDGGTFLAKDHPLARAVFNSEVVRGEQLIVTNAITGLEVPILVNAAPLSDGQGHPAGGVAVFQDISPLRDLDRQKDEFLAAISHDLKTPATIIKGNAHLLQRALARGDQGATGSTAIADGLQVIDESTAQLVRLVDELLDLTRLRMGHELELDVGPADLVKIVRRLAAEYQKISPRHTISVVSEKNRVLGDWDEARIERIVANLISNAVKYSPRGGEITIEVREEERDHQEWATLVVRDHGIGIPPGELDRVFEPYYRATNIAGTVSGSGIGLAGTRHIVEQHGGEITVVSEVGDTTFTVRLPLLLEMADILDP
ncbi:MAG: GAF domain-containing protein [Chloroflexi bacterium]|nr:MAG: GAF domain-containing protein [Chloroflexota bacterium]